MPTETSNRKRLFIPMAVCLVLAAATFALYLPVVHDDFINFDDDSYIIQNSHVNNGVTWPGIAWAFQFNGYASNWHPLTWISHMLDCQFFGLNPCGHHLVNVAFHTANTVLLFVLLNMMTGALWRSAFVAALFAWHPLHVESVAWAAERKDVLSAFFWMLTLIAYARYVKSARHRPAYYLLALLLFACGLMSKPMVVTLPFVLLLLDFWPLQRFNVPAIQRLLVEKIPFFILMVAGCVITYAVQKHTGAVSDNPLSLRIENALWSYERYIAKIFWPANLAIVYPFQTRGLPLLAILAAILLGACSVAFVALSKERRYFFVGWFWFLGTLVPAIGIVQVGSASLADRYTYLPGIGLFILITWAFADFLSAKKAKILPAAAAFASLASCLAITSIQITYWRNSITLFSHAVQVTTDNYVADACLGNALDDAGNEQAALHFCRAAVQINPDYSPGEFFLGTVLWKTGNTNESIQCIDTAAREAGLNPVMEYNFGKFFADHGSPGQAVKHFSAAIHDDPGFSKAYNALGKTYLNEGQWQAAVEEMTEAVTVEPDNAQFYYDLGTVFLSASKLHNATIELSRAVALKPDFVSAQENLGIALADQGKLPEAITHFSKITQLEPNNPDGFFDLGLTYLNNHQPAEAVAQFSKELDLVPNDTNAHYRLAQALAQQGKFPDAVSQYRQALQQTPNFPEAKKELDEILAAHPQLR